MKKYYILLLTILALASCKNDVDEIWGKLPTEREKEKRDKLSQTLISSENGWKVSYYTDPRFFGAYNFIMKFDGKKVHMQGDELFPGGVHSSLYSVTPIQGPTLVFDTYTIISQLADPMMYVAGSGLNGDNEFVWHSTAPTNDTIVFKGKKSGSRIEFIKFDGNWNEYFNNIKTITQQYTTGTMDRFFKEVVMEDGTSLLLCGYDATKRTINPIIPIRPDSIVQVVNGVNVTETGITFHDPIDFNGKKIQNIGFDAASGNFKVTDPGINAFIRPISEPEFVFTNANKEVLNNGEMYQFVTLDSQLSEIATRIANKIDNFYGLYLHPLGAASGHYITFFYISPQDELELGAYVKINTTKDSRRSDRLLIKPPLSITVGGDFASAVRSECLEFTRAIVGEGRQGRNYIVIPQEDDNYLLGCSDANTSFSLSLVR